MTLAQADFTSRSGSLTSMTYSCLASPLGKVSLFCRWETSSPEQSDKILLKPEQTPSGYLVPRVGLFSQSWCLLRNKNCSPTWMETAVQLVYYRRGSAGKWGGFRRGEGMGCQDRSCRHPIVNGLWSLVL